MDTKTAYQVTKRLKRAAKKGHNLLTFEEKAVGLSAHTAIDTLLDRSTQQNDGEFNDVVHAFANESDKKQLEKTQQRASSKETHYAHYLRSKQQQANMVEYLKKAKSKHSKLDSSSIAANKKRAHSDTANTEAPPHKKQKLDLSITDQQEPEQKEEEEDEEERDYYLLHWNTRHEDKEQDIDPLIEQRRHSMMKKMDLPAWFVNADADNNQKRKQRKAKAQETTATAPYSNYCCFVGDTRGSFKVCRNVNDAALHCHGDVVSAYSQNRAEWLRSSREKSAPNGSDGNDDDIYKLSAFDGLLLSAISTYYDVLFCCRDWKNDKHIKRVLSMHAVSHILRNEQIRNENDVKLSRNEIVVDQDINDGAIRDSGYKRLAVLIVTPFKRNVETFGKQILAQLPKQRKLVNERYKQFLAEFEFAGQDRAENHKQLRGRGLDYMHTFSGDIDDDFCVGIAIGEKGVRFMQTWSDSDIVIVSPLRLKLLMESGKSPDNGNVFDLLSSVEILMVDEGDNAEMQNIKHLLDTLHKLNLRPRLKKEDDVKKVNFDRLRYCYIDDVAPYYRQNIICTKYQTPKMRQLFEEKCLNVFGRIRVQLKYDGVLEKVVPYVRQEFYRFDLNISKSKQTEDAITDDIHERRLSVYKKYMLPIFKKNRGVKTLIFVSTYYDFLRLRSLYKAVEKNIKFISEYTAESEERKSRRAFNDGSNEDALYLVITERYYFYNRIRCHGAQRVLFYNLPTNHEYYYEILNWFDTKQQYESYALYCKHIDNLALQRIVGAKRMLKMLNNKQSHRQIFV